MEIRITSSQLNIAIAIPREWTHPHYIEMDTKQAEALIQEIHRIIEQIKKQEQQRGPL